MEDEDVAVVGGGGRLRALEAPPDDRRLRIVLRGDHHADGGAVDRAQRSLHQAAVADRGAEQCRGELAVEQRQEDLRLGVAEAGVELEDHRAVVGEHQAGVQHPAIRGPVARHPPRDRLEDLGHRALERVAAEPRHRGEGAHAAGVRPGVPDAEPLVVARRRQRHDGGVTDEREGADLDPLEALLEHDAGAGPSHREQVADGGLGVLDRLRHDDALAGGQPVGLHDGRPVERPNVRGGSVRIGDRDRSRRRDAGPLHLALREGLARLQAGRGPHRSEGWSPAGGQLVGHPGCERRLGTDDDEVVALARHVPGNRPGVGRVEVDVLADRRRPAVAGSGSHGAHAAHRVPAATRARARAPRNRGRGRPLRIAERGQGIQHRGQLVDSLLVRAEVAVRQRILRLRVQALGLRDEAVEVGGQLAGCRRWRRLR